MIFPALSDRDRLQSIAAEELFDVNTKDPMAKMATAKTIEMLVLFIRLSIRAHQYLIHIAYPHAASTLLAIIK
ncbi:MAG: hypothetical protein A2568_02680 [Candidatus Yanofskybacteria bacterium RIFOXYD1_FULL_44_17]|nr:MAG: hypothetical protein A2207_00080 [Candidatus Yanofskybacteria bacterium RIFOXYA1_FULL_44_17]OGN36532.1 MAG: hypothetical protein A2241_02225 [Candidatus Yanofskybacteria bacterium RIFOXYA2_FULL_45_28]OGN37125.1 MAG: hypothetical protein A2405_03485 [Candidatus Yanofskybacteria bacterium RIFOXYC1_FULL_44_16]OGN37669.1 MAG: hypothetical protein A2371_00970 [Candidatus Yanofskybacteria bacterium RIFOXYB1_FULL_44_29]OGN37795.1 MAG: hypothetical protein A2302_02275 [Candidatus Yanofskybacter